MPFFMKHVVSVDPALMEVLGRIAKASETIASNIPAIKRFNKMSAELDQAIADLQTAVTADTDAVNSAETLMTNLSQLLADAIAAAQNAGATPAQLQALSDLQAAVSSNASGLAASVAANTPAAP